MENKNIIRTFCGCKPSKNRQLATSKSYKTRLEALDELQDTHNIKQLKGR